MTTADPDFDIQRMRVAIEHARLSRPSPNPPVGALVVDVDGNEVSSAHHLAAGEEHAEVAALHEAGEAARGGSLYVTLEPCNHEGKTEPCVDAILASGIKRAIIGCTDPNPHVAGGGAERLREAGIEVQVGVCGSEARKLIAPWAKFITTGMPHVILKLGLSLDGRIATRTGASKWVTCPEARVKVQHLRSLYDAVAVGIGTALTDDPRLTVRDEELLAAGGSPVRILFDTSLRLPLTARVVRTASDVPTWVFAGEDASEEAEKALVDAGCVVIRGPKSADNRVDMTAALTTMAEAGVVTVMFEGGAELAGTLVAARLADELHCFIAPLLFGPRGRPGAVDWAGPDTPAEAPNIADPKWEVCGRDAYVYGSVVYPDKE